MTLCGISIVLICHSVLILVAIVILVAKSFVFTCVSIQFVVLIENQTKKKMVQTRRATRKSVIQTNNFKKENNVGKRKKIQSTLDRCKHWIQQQKKEKVKVEPEELDSNESDDEHKVDLSAVSVRILR